MAWYQPIGDSQVSTGVADVTDGAQHVGEPR